MITPEDAIAIARARAADQGWGLSEPVAVNPRRGWFGRIRSYDVVSDPSKRGGGTRFTIDASTGEILSEGHISR
jgi:hypothetical protein